MTNKEEEDSRWREQLSFANHVKMRAWALNPTLPDPIYDPKDGWTLDQFAMRFEPDLLQLYKDVMADLNRAPGNRERYHGTRWIEVSSELSDRLRARLLDPRFRVQGFRPGRYEPAVIPRPLLDGMYPVVELSELVERGIAETYRRFEKVRVFDQSTVKKTSRGRKATYDWSALEKILEREKPNIPTHAALVEWCRSQVKPIPGKSGQKDGPDDKTTRAAISNRGLWKFITPKKA